MRLWLALLVSIFLFNTARAELIGESFIPVVGVHEVDGGYEGSLASLFVEVHNGSGRVFLDTLPLTQVDLQASARLARDVACNVLFLDCSQYDFFYIVRSETPMIGGHSAGGAMAVATLSALTNKSILSDVVTTGTINPDGTIGPVSAVLEKAEAVSSAGYSRFLVPVSQSVVYDSWGDQVNLSQYAFDNWNLNVIEVMDIEHAFELMTGYSIESPSADSSEIVSDVYNGVMKSMASALKDNINSLLSVFEESLNSSVSYNLRRQLELVLAQEQESVNNISSYFNSEDYYVAASRSLQTGINIHYSLMLIEYEYAKSKKDFVKSTIDDSFSSFSEWSNLLFNITELDSFYDIELLITSLDRYYDAEELFDSAYEEYYAGDYYDALFSLASAIERFNTARTWFDTTTSLSDDVSIIFDSSKLDGLASERFSQATSAFTYASTVADSLSLSEISLVLDNALSALNSEYYVRSIFESLQVVSDSNLIMEIRDLSGDSLNDLYNRKRDNVVNVIAREKVKGSLPILSISYYAYAEDFFESGDVFNALRYINYAYHYSGLSSDVLSSLDESRFSQVQENVNILPLNQEANYSSFVILLIGLVSGVVLSFLFLSFF